nr:FG-GAP-like repeat-containing protein [Algoriphagus sp. AK58]
MDLGSAFGTKVEVFAGDLKQQQEYQPVKGYMSSVDPRLHFGLGGKNKVDSVLIHWNSGKITKLQNLASNQILQAKESDGSAVQYLTKKTEQIFTSEPTERISFHHIESDFVDFDRDRLRFWSISNEGPRAAQADVNGDGRMDLFIPAAKGKTSALLLQPSDGKWEQSQRPLFEKDSLAEDVVAHFFDANGDGMADLLVGSGGIEFSDYSPFYMDRLYLNDGKGKFSHTAQQFAPTPTSFILSHDLDQDGDLDLIIGQRVQPFAYGVPVGVQFWENDGKANFTQITSRWEELFSHLGMLTDGALADLNGDGNIELILVGEWMPVTVFTFSKGSWTNSTSEFGLENTRGFWKRILVKDLNGDGLLDILAGNQGLNSRLRTSPNQPLKMVVNDFDQNGAIEQILFQTVQNRSIPWVLKNPLLRQIPILKKQLLTYDSYKDKSLEELFPQSVWANSLFLQADVLETSLWINQPIGSFKKESLPAEIQYAPIHAITLMERRGQSPLLILGGNESRIKPEMGTHLGSYGWVLSFENHKWSIQKPQESGLFITGEIRDFQWINQENKTSLLILRNNEKPLVFNYR